MAQIFEFLKQNIGTVAVLATLVLIVVSIIRNKKRGVGSCGCGCDSCPMSDKCHASAGATDTRDGTDK